MGHFSPAPIILSPKRRNSLPPLHNVSHQNSFVLPEILETENFLNKPKLPNVESDLIQNMRCSTRQSIRSQISFNPYLIAPSAQDEECFRIVDIGYEEAGGVPQTESAILLRRNKTPEHVEYFSLNNHTQFIDLCGNITRNSTEATKPIQSVENKSNLGSLKIPIEDGQQLFAMKGNKAKYQPRPVISQTSVSRPVLAAVNRRQEQKKIPRR